MTEMQGPVSVLRIVVVPLQPTGTPKLTSPHANRQAHTQQLWYEVSRHERHTCAGVGM